MKWTGLFVAVMALGVAASFSSPVQAREFADIYTDCGLGAMIAPRNDADSCQGGLEQTASLIYNTYPSLEREIAAGQGENLDALMTLAGCPSVDRGGLVHALRESFATEVGAEAYSQRSRVEKSGRLYSVFHDTLSNQPAGQSCAVVG
jgi:hypothetical protein